MHAVDGRHPAPVDRQFLPLFTGFYTSQVVQDFFHQQYHHLKDDQAGQKLVLGEPPQDSSAADRKPASITITPILRTQRCKLNWHEFNF